MRLEDYKSNIRKYRGHLKSMDEDLYTIYHQGCRELRDWSLESKTIGIRKMSAIARMDYKEQHKFLVWVQTKKRTVKEIDVKLLELI